MVMRGLMRYGDFRRRSEANAGVQSAFFCLDVGRGKDNRPGRQFCSQADLTASACALPFLRELEGGGGKSSQN